MDNKSKALGYLIGKQIAGMRRVTKEPVAYLYNGVRLPKLPELTQEEKETYRYMYIAYSLSAFAGIGYWLLLSPVPVYAHPFWDDYNISSNGVIANAMRYELPADGSTWEYKGIIGKIDHVLSPRWCNSDMYLLAEDGDGNWTVTDTVHLPASEPIPVYE